MASIFKKVVIYDEDLTEGQVVKETARIIKNRYLTTKAEAKSHGYHAKPEKQFEIEIKVRRL